MYIVLIIIQFYLALWPFGGETNAENLFGNYVSVLLVLVLYAGAKIYYRARRWVDISTIGLDSIKDFTSTTPTRKMAEGSRTKDLGCNLQLGSSSCSWSGGGISTVFSLVLTKFVRSRESQASELR